MKKSYHTIGKQGKVNEQELAGFLAKNGQFLMLWIAKIPPGREMRLSIGPGDRFGRRFPFGTARCVTAEGTKRALRHTSLAIHLQLRREILATTTQAARS